MSILCQKHLQARFHHQFHLTRTFKCFIASSRLLFGGLVLLEMSFVLFWEESRNETVLVDKSGQILAETTEKLKHDRSSMSYQLSQRLRARNCSTVLGLWSSAWRWSCVLARLSWLMMGTPTKEGALARCLNLSGYSSELTWLESVAELSLRSFCKTKAVISQRLRFDYRAAIFIFSQTFGLGSRPHSAAKIGWLRNISKIAELLGALSLVDKCV